MWRLIRQKYFLENYELNSSMGFKGLNLLFNTPLASKGLETLTFEPVYFLFNNIMWAGIIDFYVLYFQRVFTIISVRYIESFAYNKMNTI